MSRLLPQRGRDRKLHGLLMWRCGKGHWYERSVLLACKQLSRVLAAMARALQTCVARFTTNDDDHHSCCNCTSADRVARNSAQRLAGKLPRGACASCYKVTENYYFLIVSGTQGARLARLHRFGFSHFRGCVTAAFNQAFPCVALAHSVVWC